MSRKSREKRAATATANAEERAERGRTAGWPRSRRGTVGAGGVGFDHLSAEELVDAGLNLLHRGDDTLVRRLVAPPIGGDLAGFRAVIGPRLAMAVAGIWQRGWQPVEAVRHVRRGCPQVAVRLLLVAIAVDHRQRPPSSLDPRWAAQVASLDLPVPATEGAVDTGTDANAWIRAWMVGEEAETDEAIVAALDVLMRLMAMPPLEALIAPPGAAADWRAKVGGCDAAGADAARAGAAADPVLEKVRALLAKAESTSFEAEAEAFTAKAQELIARHAIDAALLAVGDDDGDGPSAIRVCIDDPYVDAKSLLLQVVADAGRCRSVFLGSLAMSTVVGFASDLAAVEMLFTSLLVQAQTAMASAARSAPPGSRTRSRGFRSAFLQSYASRIGQRLQEVNDAVVAESTAEHGRSILPVLASRGAVIDGTVDDLFGSLTTHRLRGGTDAAGWASGRFAADNAQLGGGVLPPSSGGRSVTTED